MSTYAIVKIVVLVIGAISASLGAAAARRRMSNAVGRKIESDVELTSIKLWMNASDQERAAEVERLAKEPD